MKYNIVLEVNTDNVADLVGLSATVVYVLNNQLKQIPGITQIVISELTAEDTSPISEE